MLLNWLNSSNSLFTTEAGAQLLYQVIKTSWAGGAALQELLTVHQLLRRAVQDTPVTSTGGAAPGVAVDPPQSVVLVAPAAAAAAVALALLVAPAAVTAGTFAPTTSSRSRSSTAELLPPSTGRAQGGC
jgi:hypothetical protein